MVSLRGCSFTVRLMNKFLFLLAVSLTVPLVPSSRQSVLQRGECGLCSPAGSRRTTAGGVSCAGSRGEATVDTPGIGSVLRMYRLTWHLPWLVKSVTLSFRTFPDICCFQCWFSVLFSWVSLSWNIKFYGLKKTISKNINLAKSVDNWFLA